MPENSQSRKTRVLLSVRVEFEGEISGREIKSEGHSTDLNATGCSVESDQHLSPGIYLTLRIHLSNSTQPVTVTLARVRWAKDFLFGVEFIQLPRHDQHRLNDLTMDNLEGVVTSKPLAPLSPQEGRYTILIVDDDLAMRHLCATMLTRDGFKVLEASGSPEAVEICTTHVGDIHIALVDVMLQPPSFQLKPEKLHSPRVHGHILVKGLTANRKELRTIMMSTNSKASLATNGIDLSEVPFLLKPFSHEKMLAVIRQQLKTHTHSTTP